MKIIIAPNSFKGSLDAFKVAKAIELGLQKSSLTVDCHLFPIADGGDHTLEVFYNWLGGFIQTTQVFGPLGEVIKANWLWIEDEKTAVIEMAKASGLSLIKKSELNPLKANSYGTGQLIKKALETGAEKIIVGIGGSATIDGGLGILQALGGDLFDKKGKQIDRYSNPLMDFSDISISNIDQRIYNAELLILCDVENPLLGDNGAVNVFGTQKGANQAALEMLEKSMEQFNSIVKHKTGKDLSLMKGAGAAGGIAVSLKAFFNASLVSGVDFLLEKMGFDEEIKDADILITAEGKVDFQTLQGKGPMGVAAKAKEYGIPSIILAGKADDIDLVNHGFSAIFPITNGPGTLEEAMNRTAIDLEDTAHQIGNLIALVGRL